MSTDDEPHDPHDPDDAPAREQVDGRALLLPEEQTVGSDDPLTQAEVILEESRERTEHPDPDDSSQSGRRTSDERL